MKKLAIAISFLILSFQLYAQDQTLINGQLESGGFGSPVVKFSNINSKPAIFVGGYGGWLINHTFLIGGGGYGLVNSLNASQTARDYYGYNSDLKILMGYCGLVLECIGDNESLIHYTVSTLIGAGGVTYRYPYNQYLNSLFNHNNINIFNLSAFFVFEPTLNVELNVAKFFRITAGAGYRFISGTDLVGIKDADLAGPSFSLAFIFGIF
jgi:hypothetical protein